MDTTAYEKLLNAGFRFVSFRPRSKKEIEDFLRKKIISWKLSAKNDVEPVLARLTEYGHIDDRKFASWWVQQRSSFRPKGARALAMELQQKGISRENIESVLSEADHENAGFNEEKLARLSIQKKAGKWEALPELNRKKKIYSYLSLRGFSSGTISKIIDEIVKKEYNS